jgi:hypothetical protein
MLGKSWVAGATGGFSRSAQLHGVSDLVMVVWHMNDGELERIQKEAVVA